MPRRRAQILMMAHMILFASLTTSLESSSDHSTISPTITSNDMDFNGTGCLFENCLIRGTGTDARIELDLNLTGVWKERAPSVSPAPRCWHAMAAIGNDDKIILYGGLSKEYSGWILLNDTWVYDLSENTWTHTFPPRDPSGRYAHAMATIWGDDKVVLYGGHSNNMTDSNINGTWVYDLSENQWFLIDTGVHPYPSRWGHAMASSINDSGIFLYGGRAHAGGYLSDFWRYDIKTNQWCFLATEGNPGKRSDHSMAAIWNDDKFVMFGGYNDYEFTNETWVYDTSENRWSLRSQSNPPSARWRQTEATVFFDDKAIMFGGCLLAPNIDWAETWIYDAGDDQWYLREPSDKPPGRSTTAMAPVKNKDLVVLFGGYNFSSGNVLNDTWVYSFSPYLWNGTYRSPYLDLGGPSRLVALCWTAAAPPGTSILFQLRAAESESALQSADFVGPDGTPDSYYTENSTIHGVPHGARWFQYRALLKTENQSLTPSLYKVVITYNRIPEAPALVSPPEKKWTNVSRPVFTWIFRDADSSVQGGYELQLDRSLKFSPALYTSGEVESGNTSHAPSISIKDGVWYWRVRTRDRDGDWGPFSEARELWLDATPPRPFAPEAAPSGWTSVVPSISYSTSDDASGIDRYEFFIDGEAYAFQENPFTPPDPGEGAHEVVVRAFDRAGNFRDGRVEICIDRSPPEPFEPLASPPCWTRSAPQIFFNAEDRLSGVERYEVSVDGGPFTVHSSPCVLPDLSDGTHNVVVRAHDRAGNFREANVTVYIDRTAPEFLGLSVEPSGWTNGDPVVVFVAEDGLSGVDRYEVSVDGGNFSIRTSPLAIENLSDGSHTIVVRAFDRAGNFVEGTATALVDRTPPMPFEPVVVPGGWTNTPPEVRFNTSDGLSGIAGYELRVGNGSFVKATSPWRAEGVEDGVHEVTVRALDAAGNYREARSTIYIDRTPPAGVSVLINGGARSTERRMVRLTIFASDNLSGPYRMRFSSDGVNYTGWEPFSTERNWTLPGGYGTKTIHVVVSDRAGNEAEAVARIVYRPPGEGGPLAGAALPALVVVACALGAAGALWLWRRWRAGKARR
ncbi:MAG: kelch repeat-containing protein [Thermoplasmata archaeon]